MPRRRLRNNNQLRMTRTPRWPILNYEFEGLANVAVGSGIVSEIPISYAKLTVPADRPYRPAYCSVVLGTTGNNAVNFAIAGVDPADQTIAILSRVTYTSGTSRSVRIRWPIPTDYTKPLGTDLCFKLRVYTASRSDGANTTVPIIYSGRVGIQFDINNTPASVKPA